MKGLIEMMVMQKVENKQNKTLKLVGFQPDEELVKITVGAATYAAAKEGTQIKVHCTIREYDVDGNKGVSIKEVF